MNRKRGLYGRFLLSAACALLCASFANATLIVVPNSRAASEGDVSMTLSQGLRYQQVFGASQFAALPAGGALITQIAFRPDESIDTPMVVLSSPGVAISMSTTSKPPEGLVGTYASNVGPDVTTVFNGPLALTATGSGPAAGPKTFDAVITLTTPFLYDPAGGNLLLDMSFALLGASTFRALDANSSSSDGTSRNLGGAAGTTGTPNAVAFVVQFNAAPRAAAPEPAMLFLVAFGLIAVAAITRRRSS